MPDQVILSLVAQAEGLYSHLNPPPALPATAARGEACVRMLQFARVSAVAGLKPLGRPGSSVVCGNSSK